MELVVYFSASGKTRKKALELATKKNCESFEIEPEVIYTNEDLNWMNPNSRSSIEMKDEKCRPKIKNIDAHIEKYDKVYLGFPIWWYIAPKIINTFLEKYDFSNKELVLFATSGSSGWGETETCIRESVDATCKITMGKVNDINGI